MLVVVRRQDLYLLVALRCLWEHSANCSHTAVAVALAVAAAVAGAGEGEHIAVPGYNFDCTAGIEGTGRCSRTVGLHTEDSRSAVGTTA